jgi:hypothetical protein
VGVEKDGGRGRRNGEVEKAASSSLDRIGRRRERCSPLENENWNGSGILSNRLCQVGPLCMFFLKFLNLEIEIV